MALRQIELTERFKKDFKRLPREVAKLAQEIIRDHVMPWPTKGSLRHHTLSGYTPPIHKIDVMPNKAYQITFWVDGDTARLLRIATHGDIDRNPR
jgi:mRNA-degrading endonuclease YafQ of YafQ-DinJ toxin-antitoxin module